MQAGDVLADRYRLDDLLAESGAGRFWRAHDLVLHRPVAVHILAADDPRADAVLEAARTVGPVINRRLLRVLDAEVAGAKCYVVNEWGQGDSLDILLTREGPLPPRRAAWLVAEVADSIAEAHAAGIAHGCLTPENVLVDQHGQVRIIGFGVEAALRGLPPGRVTVDEIDLAGLLYCALTGKWAGVSTSAVPSAPEVHGEVLRPRRVRAGIPRPLDTLCDQVLNPEHAPGGGQADHTARRINELLRDYVGDVVGTHAPVAGPRPAAPATSSYATQAVPVATPEPAPPSPEPEAHPEPEPEPEVEAVSEPAPEPAPTAVTDLPTQAGMPVFHDDDEVDWLRARADKPAPPPPLETPAPKPLFAPDPPEGEPVRRPRPGTKAATAGSDYWPWDDSRHGSSVDATGRPAGRDTGSWGSGHWTDDRWGTGEGFDDTDDRVPGRSWNRLALAVIVVLLVGVAVVAAYQLGIKPPASDSDDEPSTSASPSVVTPTPFTGLVADDFDPQGDAPQEENPDQVPNAVDGDPATTWSTSTYRQNFGPGGLKTGVGLVIDLGASKGVREVVVSTVGGQTALAAYVTSEPPTGVAGLTPVGTAAGTGDLTISLDEAVSGRYVTVWLTLIPSVGADEFRGTISEVQVLG
ncbi:Protein kinase domain-containing protein [Nocardioides exalbidus]|uniref:Protein kinase domain-containing protein n=1 Tax=Nocardioides exalbidus TaxID=402596 RepID=A0A1H4P634_9ACTN|nr:protein kinase family protein [Nocardioides exalbidus]SEC02658.1 Protein kinase domain-containing protein [Nocardioides exalbidus]